jgi:hypothetical protein
MVTAEIEHVLTERVPVFVIIEFPADTGRERFKQSSSISSSMASINSMVGYSFMRPAAARP